MPGFKVSNGSTYVDPKGISVSNGSTYVAAKGVYVSQGNGTWTPVWPLLSTVALSGPAYAMSTSSGGNSIYQSWNTIVSPTFTITLSNPSAVSHVSFQLSHEGGGWVEYNAWTSGIAATLTFTMGFYSTGSWRAQAVITHTGGSQVTSNIHNLSCLAFSINTSCDTTTPQVGVQTQVGAGMVPGAPGDFPNTPEGWYISRNGAAWQRPTDWGWTNTANPLYWTPGDTATFRWLWVESFPDGSRIHSAHVDQAPWVYVPPPPTEVVAPAAQFDGGNASAAALQQAMNYARNSPWGNLPLRLSAGSNWYFGGATVWIPSGLTINAGGAVIYLQNGRIRNSSDTAGSAMPASCGGYAGGTFNWQGGTFDGGGGGIFTLSHSPGYTINGCTFQNQCTSTNKGHAIESNSSGGADQGLNAYTVHITNNTFNGSQFGQRPNANDEPVHYDFAWQGSGCAGAEDMTMCHNHYIAANTFWSPWEHAKTAIGGHRMSSASYCDVCNVPGSPSPGCPAGSYLTNPDDGNPAERHNSFLIEGNVIYGAVGATDGVSPNKGSIALFSLRSVHIRNNAFYGCIPGVSGLLVSGFDETQNLNSATCNINIYSNTHDGSPVTITMPAAGSTGG